MCVDYTTKPLAEIPCSEFAFTEKHLLRTDLSQVRTDTSQMGTDTSQMGTDTSQERTDLSQNHLPRQLNITATEYC